MLLLVIIHKSLSRTIVFPSLPDPLRTISDPSPNDLLTHVAFHRTSHAIRPSNGYEFENPRMTNQEEGELVI